MWSLHIFIICVWTTNCVLAKKGNNCCPENHVLSSSPDADVPYCLNPEGGNTTDIVLNCTQARIMPRGMLNMFRVDEEGKLLMTINGEQNTIQSEEFCVGNVSNKNFTKTRFTYVVCTSDGDDKDVDGHEAVLAYCIIVSVICLAITAIIYAAFSELRDLQGKSIVSFCLSLATALGALAVLKKISLPTFHHCAAAVFINYFFLMSSFFWMNGISIQILQSLRKPLINKYDWREYKWYAVYAWGSATVLTTLLIVVNYYPGDHVRPGIGITSCWYNSKRQMWYYMYSVMTIMILINICIFVYISIILWRNTFSSTHTKALKYKITMTLRLFIIMGVPWIFEMISSLFEKHMIWFILDILNLMQGLLMFLLLVVFRKRVVNVIYRHGWLDCMSGPVERWLAITDDDEDHVMQTTEVPMDDKKRNERS